VVCPIRVRIGRKNKADSAERKREVVIIGGWDKLIVGINLLAKFRALQF
jgi:hypothetical protein